MACLARELLDRCSDVAFGGHIHWNFDAKDNWLNANSLGSFPIMTFGPAPPSSINGSVYNNPSCLAPAINIDHSVTHSYPSDQKLARGRFLLLLSETSVVANLSRGMKVITAECRKTCQESR
jgi:hypothetical protein